MKVLLINGSPKKEGCTNRALEEVAKSLEIEGIETEIFHIGTEPIRGCMGCGGCAKNQHRCVFKDTVNEAIEKMDTADGLIVGSPVHFASASGMITSFLDRMFYASKNCAYKPGAAIVSARRAGTSATLDQLNKYFTIRNMPVVSSRYWNMVHGTTKDEVEQDLEGLQTMRILGKNMAWMIKTIEAGKNAGILPPQEETPIRTSFIR